MYPHSPVGLLEFNKLTYLHYFKEQLKVAKPYKFHLSMLRNKKICRYPNFHARSLPVHICMAQSKNRYHSGIVLCTVRILTLSTKDNSKIAQENSCLIFNIVFLVF